MPYKVKIADTEENNTFLKNLPKDILTKLSEHLQLLGLDKGERRLRKSYEGALSDGLRK